jgi:hypothetical protein
MSDDRSDQGLGGSIGGEDQREPNDGQNGFSDPGQRQQHNGEDDPRGDSEQDNDGEENGGEAEQREPGGQI